MNKKFFGIITAIIFVFCALGIGALFLFPAKWNVKKNSVEHQARIVIPQNVNTQSGDTESAAELAAHEDSISTKVPLEDGEVVISILNENNDGGAVERQYVAYRNLLEAESPIYLTYIDYDETSRTYKRFWSAPTAATRPGTVSLSTQDLLGDRSICVLLSGLNGLGEHTLTIFRKNPAAKNDLFTKIAEIRIDGTISVREAERSQAYQLGLSRGQSFTIAAYGRDFESSNIMDQVEIIYEYNTVNGLFQQKNITRIPGTQIEQRRVRELLGNTKSFEDFITGLWYYVTPQGTIDKRQYIYFDPPSQEIIFYGDETQQVFTWQNSSATRYGLYIASQNISITTLRRSIDIELESLDSIKVKVFEDVRMNIKGVNAPWDGSYRKAGPPENTTQKPQQPGNTFIDAFYDSPIGKIHFLSNGVYELNAGGTIRQGNYSFFSLNGDDFLELRSMEPRTNETHTQDTQGTLRETYLITDDENQAADSGSASDPGPESEKSEKTEKTAAALRKTLTLLKVRIGARGVERINESTITLTLTSD